MDISFITESFTELELNRGKESLELLMVLKTPTLLFHGIEFSISEKRATMDMEIAMIGLMDINQDISLIMMLDQYLLMSIQKLILSLLMLTKLI